MDTSARKKKAKEAVERRNYEYAIDLYRQVLEIDPNDVDARQALRAVEIRHVKEKGVSRVSAVLKSLGVLLRLLIGSKDQDKVINDCETYLQNDPTNVWVLKKLGAAAFAAGYNGAAIGTFDFARGIDGADVTVLRFLQAVQRAAGKTEEALATNQAILKLAPADREASQALRDLSATGMAKKIEKAAVSGERGKAVRDVQRSDEETERLAFQEHALRTADDVRRAIGYAKGDVEKEPEDPKLLIKLGDLHVRIKEYNKAEEAYNKARELDAAQYSFVMKLQDLEIRKMKDVEDKFKAKLKEAADDEQAKSGLKEAHKKTLAYMRTSYEKREKQFPTDLRIAFDLASVYYELGLLDECIARYQRTMRDPNRRSVSLLRLGVSFAKKGQIKLAVDQLTQGVIGIELLTDMKKLLLYTRGKVYQQTDDKEKARADYLAIYENDIKYKDVAKRLEELGE